MHLVPVLRGEGVRLLDRLGPGPVRLECVRTLPKPEVTHPTYRVRRDEPV
ncbi:hypothetical protein AB0K09_20035 [Streptomyces sp. NPDC049577]